MMRQKVTLLLIPVLLICFFECGSPTPKKIILDVPFYSQGEYDYYCAVACIKMWAAYDGNLKTLHEIAAFVGVGMSGVEPDDIVKGVGNFTASEGYKAMKNEDAPGAQGDLISATVVGVKDGYPSIIPIYFGNHAIIARGYEWHDGLNDKPIADRIYFHDPNDFPNRTRTAGDFMNAYFFPSRGKYWVILAFEFFLDDGIDGHDDFIMAGGTYYGGPIIYDPKGLNPDPVE